MDISATEEWLAQQAAAEILDFDAERGKLNGDETSGLNVCSQKQRNKKAGIP